MVAGFAWSLSVALLAALVYAAGYLHGRRRRTRRHGGYIPLSQRVSAYGNHTTGKTRTPPGTSTASNGLRATAAVSIPGRATSAATTRTSSRIDSGNATASPRGGRMTDAEWNDWAYPA